MPDSYGKRHRNEVKARKAAAHDARRVARTKRRAEGGSDELDRDASAPPEASSGPGPAPTQPGPELPVPLGID